MNNKGFTLIELLVVVLIIGILAAIALPQYTRAVERSRTAEAVQWLGNVASAQQIFYMQNNRFATSRDDLNTGDITIPPISTNWNMGSNGTWTPADGDGSILIGLERANGLYQGGTFHVQIFPDGRLDKECTTDGGGFCSRVSSMGFRPYWETSH